MLQIHLARVGKKNQPQFRIVVADHTKPVNTNFIEVLGAYHPKSKDNKIQSLKQGRLLYWIKLGAHLTPRIAVILKPHIETVPEFIKKEIKKTQEKIAKRKTMSKKKEKLGVPAKAGEKKSAAVQAPKKTKTPKAAAKPIITKKEEKPQMANKTATAVKK